MMSNDETQLLLAANPRTVIVYFTFSFGIFQPFCFREIKHLNMKSGERIDGF